MISTESLGNMQTRQVFHENIPEGLIGRQKRGEPPEIDNLMMI